MFFTLNYSLILTWNMLIYCPFVGANKYFSTHNKFYNSFILFLFFLISFLLQLQKLFYITSKTYCNK